MVIRVRDVNDNAPTFERSEYKIELNENADINRPIMSLPARDFDISAENSLIMYRTEGNNSKFKVCNNTGKQFNEFSYVAREDKSLRWSLFAGELLVHGILDYESMKEHYITVIAYNPVRPMLSSSVSVLVSLLDVNDERPSIDVYTTSADNVAVVTEHSHVGTFVAHLVVADGDATAPNNDAYCDTNSTEFALTPLFDMEYSLSVAVDIDREAGGPQTTAIVTCRDLGQPALETHTMIQVSVSMGG